MSEALRRGEGRGEPLWTSAEIAAATGGALLGPAFEAVGVSIDTRSLQPGDLFAALRGARDGEAFTADALARGAAGVLTREPGPGPGVRVGDVLAALEALGRAARIRSGARRCAVTGSVGKTSVTQALAAALAASGPTHASVRSFNNHIGVPLTLARMPRRARFAVFEIGMNHAEEIRPLARLVEPHVCVVTTVGQAHVENFADGEAGVARAKAEIFDGFAGSGVAILNADNVWTPELARSARARGAEVWTFGAAEGARARLLSFEPAGAGGRLEAEVSGRRLRLEQPQGGRHAAMNALAVLLAVEALGGSGDDAVQALAAMEPLAGRGARADLLLDGRPVLLVDESYNANPVSMAAAISAFAAVPARRRLLALTDMLELGEASAAAHAGLAAPILAAGIDRVFLAGPAMRGLWDVLPDALRGAWAEDAESLAPVLLGALAAGDAVMVKGSNGSRAGRVAEALRAAGELAPKARS